MNARFFKMPLLAVLAATAFAASAAPGQISTVLNTTIISGQIGTWVFSPSGKLSHCLRLKSGVSGAPLGQCGVIGAVGAAPAGYHIEASDTDLHLINKTTGAIWLCTIIMTTGNTARGGCSQVSTLSALQ